MAKPDQPVPSSSRSQLTPVHIHDQQPQQRRRRTRQPRSRKLPVTSPSTAVLAALATISAAASTVDGHPLDQQPPPPVFLCPLLAPDQQPASPLLPSPSPSRCHNTRRDLSTPPGIKRDSTRPFVPDKYEQGQDGRWRKSSSWSLYGSSFCAVSISFRCSPIIMLISARTPSARHKTPISL